MADPDLDEALDAARRGDESGVVVLWRAMNPPLLRYTRVLVGDSAEDVASETWLTAAREIRGYRGDADGFRVWLFRTARHRALDELRRTGRRQEDPVGRWTEDRPAREDTADQAVERLDTARALRLIARLPRDQAEAVLLRAVAGLDVAQCAGVLGKRAGAVRVAAMRGLRRLAALLAEGALDDMPDGAGEEPRPRTTDGVRR